MARYFDDAHRQTTAVTTREQTDNSVQNYSSQDTEDLAKRTGAITKAASWLQPDAAFSLAQAGVTPDDPDFKKIAQAAGKQKVSKGFGWHSIGDAVSFVPKKVIGAQYTAIKGVSRGIDVAARSGGEFVNARAREIASGDYGKAIVNAADPFLYANPGTRNLSQVNNRVQATADQGAAKILGDQSIAPSPTALNKIRHDAYSETTAGITGERLANGQKVDLGSGFFAPGANQANIRQNGTAISSIVTEQAARARAAGPTVGGEAGTLGRYLADSVTQPGTTAYNLLSGAIDAGVQISTDPTGKVLGAVGKGAKLTKFNDPKEMAGLVDGTRKQVATIRADRWLTSEDGAKVTKFFQDSDFNTLYKQYKGKVPAEALVKLADAKTPEEVNATLRPMLGLDINQPLATPKNSKAVFNTNDILFKRSATRLKLLMPSNQVNLDDVDDAIQQVQRAGINAKLPQSIIDKRIEDVARATGRNGRYKAVYDLADDIAQHLSTREINAKGEVLNIDGRAQDVAGPGTKVRVGSEVGSITNKTDDGYEVMFRRKDDSGVMQDVFENHKFGDVREANGLYTRGEARKLTKLFSDEADKHRLYFVDGASGENMKVPGARVDGKDVAAPEAHLFAEHIGQYVPLPDAREIREATSSLGRFLQGKAPVKYTVGGVERSVPMSQVMGKYAGKSNKILDMLANGAWKTLALARGAYTVRVVGEEQLRMAAAGYDSIINHPLSAIAMVTGRKASNDLLGDDFKDAAQHAKTATDFANAMSRGLSYEPAGKTIFSQQRTFQLADLDHRDEFVKGLSNELLMLHDDEVVSEFLRNGADAAKEAFANGHLKHIREDIAQAPNRGGFKDPKIADEYINSIVARVKNATQDNPDLIDALRTGQLNGNYIRKNSEGLYSATEDFKAHLHKLADEGNVPSNVVGQIANASNEGGKQIADHFVDWMFYQLASRPSNYLSRSSVFKQAYWDKAEEILPYMDQDAQNLLLKSAREAKLDKSTLKRIEESVKSSDAGDLTAEEADKLSKAHGLLSTKDLLYDAQNRSQFFDVTRNVFAFGDAWKEVIQQWSKLTAENPALIRRGQQLIEGGRNIDPDNDNRGFFYKDPTTGEETFNYPFSQWVNEKVLGQAIPLSAPLKGLNIFGSIVPGVGPVVQVTAGAFLPDTPNADTFHKLIFPMGQTDRSGGFVESFLPPWMKRLGQSLTDGNIDERQFNTTVFNIQAQLMAGDKYDSSDPADVSASFVEARQKAKWLYLLQAGAAFAAPASPRQEFLVKDQTGNLVMMDILKNDLQSMYEQDKRDGTNNAMSRFIDKYGTDSAYLVVPRSEQVKGFVPVTKAGKDFSRDHVDLAENYPKVYGLFAPSDGGFDIDEWSRQYRNGERVPLRADQVQQRAEQLIGRAQYRQAQAKLDGRTDKTATKWLADQKAAIIKQYPGFGESSFSPTQTTVYINEMKRAMTNPTVAATDAGQGFAQYNEYRDQALAEAKKRGLSSFSDAAKAQNLRDWLNDKAEEISQDHPDFRNMWDQVLSSETSKDTTTK